MRLIRRPWKGCQFWDVPFTIPWKGCKFQKWGFPKWGYRIWFFGVFNMLHMLSYDHQGGLGGRVLTSLTSTSLTVRNMYTLRMLSYDHQGGCINVLDEYFLYVKEHGNTSKNGDLMRPMSMLHTKNQQVYKKRYAWAYCWTWRHNVALLQSVASALPQALWHWSVEKRKKLDEWISPWYDSDDWKS